MGEHRILLDSAARQQRRRRHDLAEVHRQPGHARPDRVEQVFDTLAQFDVVNHCRRILVPALFSVGLVDTITPPSTVFNAYNHYAGMKQIEVYQFNGHEGGGAVHFERQVEFARSLDS